MIGEDLFEGARQYTRVSTPLDEEVLFLDKWHELDKQELNLGAELPLPDGLKSSFCGDMRLWLCHFIQCAPL